MKKRLIFTATTIMISCFVLLGTEHPSKAQVNNDVAQLYSGCGYLLAETLYGSTTNEHLYSGSGYLLADFLY